MMNLIKELWLSLGAFKAASCEYAATETVNGITWNCTVNDGKAKVYHYGEWSTAIPSSTTGAITIPFSLVGYLVTNIGDYVFCGCDSLPDIAMPDSWR